MDRIDDPIDVFTSRPVLTLVPPITCGTRLQGWVCIAEQHPEATGHYFVKDTPDPVEPIGLALTQAGCLATGGHTEPTPAGRCSVCRADLTGALS